MADLTLTASQIALVDEGKESNTEVYPFLTSIAVTPGLVVSWTTAGKLALADANVASIVQQARGITLRTAGTREACAIVKRGRLYGFDLSGLAYGAKVYLSDTAGALADAASATKTVTVGQVMPLSDSDATKVLYVDFDWIAGY